MAPLSGPFLFMIYINDLAQIVQLNIRLFVDDTSLFVISDPGDEDLVAIQLYGDLSAIKIWAHRWFITLNESKTYSLKVRNRQRQNFLIYMNGKQISGDTSHRHLGVIINECRAWTEHIESIYIIQCNEKS